MANKPIDWERIREEYAEGASDVEIAKLLDMTEEQFYRTESDNQAFAIFVQKGRTLSKAWWYELSRRNVRNKEFNTPLYVMNMKNRFGWADKIESNDTTNKEPVNLDQMRSDLRKQMERLAKKDPDLRGLLTKDGTSD